MKNPLIRLIVGAAIIAAPALMAAEADALAPTTEIAATAAEFVAKLPPKVFVYASDQAAHAAVGRGIESLGPTPGTEFFILPVEAKAPVGSRRDAPLFLRETASGSTWILALIAPSGAVTAVYCLEATHPDLGAQAARAIAKWKYRPARVDKNAVPVIFAQRVDYKGEKG